jgi:hydrogenase nickel incorporation protein HypA/HybF
MHEMAVCEAIAGAVARHAGDRQVSKVLVQIGHLRQVVPDALTFSWQMMTTGTGLDGSVLEIDQVPATVRCRVCSTETTLDSPLLACAGCSSFDVELLTGEEFSVVSLELADA